jgi:hypothetical protein
LLRERRATTLATMKTDALDLEGNLVVVGKNKYKVENFETKKKREDNSTTTSSYVNNQDQKINEIEKMVKYLSSKMAKFEITNKIIHPNPLANPQRNLYNNFGVFRTFPRKDIVPYRRPFNPQLLNREKKVVEPPPQVPLRVSNNMIEDFKI